MTLYDQHVHSNLSFDCDTDAEDNILRAQEIGLAGITFTEHFDTHPTEWDECIYDDEVHSAVIKSMRDRFAGEIFIGKGIEVCFQPSRMEFILNFLARHSFDLVILSVHFFGDLQIGRRENWQGYTSQQVTEMYFDKVLEAARFCENLHKRNGPVFNVLAHLDLINRYATRFTDDYDPSPHREKIDDILRACLEADLVPEINTSTLRQGLNDTMPDQTTISRYAELGGKAISLGSDAHIPESVGADFDVAQAMMHAAGIRHLATFQRQDCALVEIAD